MAELNLTEKPSDKIIRRIKKTLKKLKAKRISKLNPFTFFWDYSDITVMFRGLTLKVDNDNWTGITLHGDDEAIEAFIAVYNDL